MGDEAGCRSAGGRAQVRRRLKEIADALVAWFIDHQRPLPWRETYDPYHVWLSEVMLQQTQVETVLPYYERFLKTFPNLRRLASSSEEEVLRLWQGLGYYNRIRNFRRAAQLVRDEFGGRIPEDPAVLTSLPGVGRYMAGAILSIAFNQAQPIVDGNVRRVLSRLRGWPAPSDAQVWEAAGEIVRHGEPRSINQSLMELGATVCSFKKPRCLLCPVQRHCTAFRIGKPGEIPEARKRPASVRVLVYAVVCQKRGHLLMRPNRGMWEVPTFAELPAGRFAQLGSCRHTITHHRLDVVVVAGELARDREMRWKRPQSVAISSLSRKVLSVAKAKGSDRLETGPPAKTRRLEDPSL